MLALEKAIHCTNYIVFNKQFQPSSGKLQTTARRSSCTKQVQKWPLGFLLLTDVKYLAPCAAWCVCTWKHTALHVQRVPGATLKTCQQQFLVNLNVCICKKVAVLFRYTNLSALLPTLVPYLFFR